VGSCAKAAVDIVARAAIAAIEATILFSIKHVPLWMVLIGDVPMCGRGLFGIDIVGS
jgi:hypothetical protein